MAAPAIAATLRASEFPNIAFGVASAFELMTSIVTEGTHTAAMTAELIAYADADGNLPFPDGVTTTEDELAVIVEARPQHGEAFVLIVQRYGYDFVI